MTALALLVVFMFFTITYMIANTLHVRQIDRVVSGNDAIAQRGNERQAAYNSGRRLERARLSSSIKDLIDKYAIRRRQVVTSDLRFRNAPPPAEKLRELDGALAALNEAKMICDQAEPLS